MPGAGSRGVDTPALWGERDLGTATHLQGDGHGGQPAIDLTLERERADPGVEVGEGTDFGGIGLANRTG